jgi:hypothetical protein
MSMVHVRVRFLPVQSSLGCSGRFTLIHAVYAARISPRELPVLVTILRICTLPSGAIVQGWVRKESHDRLPSIFSSQLTSPGAMWSSEHVV